MKVDYEGSYRNRSRREDVYGRVRQSGICHADREGDNSGNGRCRRNREFLNTEWKYAIIRIPSKLVDDYGDNRYNRRSRKSLPVIWCSEKNAEVSR